MVAKAEKLDQSVDWLLLARTKSDQEDAGRMGSHYYKQRLKQKLRVMRLRGLPTR